MINGLRTFRTNLKGFNLQKVQRRIIEENADVIADLQAAVLAEGKDKSGQVRQDEYEPVTVRFKRDFGKGLGAVTDRVTFYMTGEMYKSFFTYLSAKTFEVRSPLDRYNKMIARIGEENFGLDHQRKMQYFEEINRPQVRLILYEKTGLKF